MFKIYLRICVWLFLLFAASSSPVDQNTTFVERTGRLRILSLTHPRKELKNESRKNVVFPDETKVIFGIGEVPKCANGETFCEHFDTYPDRHIRKMLQGNKDLSLYFGGYEEGPVIVNRHGSFQESYGYLCPSLQKTVSPKVGKNKDNKWKFIINQKEDGYIQTVRVEMCKRANAACDIIGGLPLGFTTTCRQKYIHRRLLSLNDVGEPSPDTFKLPAACCCSYKRNLDYIARVGGQKFNDVTPAKTFKLS